MTEAVTLAGLWTWLLAVQLTPVGWFAVIFLVVVLLGLVLSA